MSTSDHKDLTRQAFTTQAESYASSALIAADESRRQFVDFVAPQPTDRVLDVATGPGFLALLFAERVAEVVGIDLTEAMLARAEANRRERGLRKVRFEAGDAEALRYPDESFDCVVCGSAFHHFAQPSAVLGEMVRVTKRGCKVALLDIITSEVGSKAALHNQVEHERDPSHVRSLPLSEMVQLFEQHGLREVRTHTYQTPRELGEWFAISHTLTGVAERVRAEFIKSIADDATGLHVSRDGERVHFM
ncbi:MAG: methyltransferase domain-containing protein, partial [Chloroflexi bacterium]|nr:methyltransferase domain-containing protein [Chloroflexota bacterium]